jgi:uncharacterized protein (TIGR03435 family)
MQAANVRVGLILLIVVANASRGQEPPKLNFEAASMRSSSPGDQKQERPIDGLRSGGPGTSNPGRIVFFRVPLDRILAYAFDVPWARISGPNWIVTERYDIIAKLPERTTAGQARVMLQNLLVERLHLVFHLGTKTFAAYELRVASAGTKLKESIIDPETAAPGPQPEPLATRDKDGFPILPPGVHFAMRHQLPEERVFATFSHTLMSEFASFLGARLGGEFVQGSLPMSIRTVPTSILDKTALTGRYDFTFAYDGFPATVPDTFSITLSALQSALDRQLGLKLVKANALLDVLVVDNLERKPDEN